MLKVMGKALGLALVILLPAFSAFSDEEPIEVYWEDLVPEGFNELAPPAVQHLSLIHI